MRCLFSRWLISRAADRGAPLPQRTERHLEGCARCHAFRERLVLLGSRLTAARQAAPLPAEKPASRRRAAAWTAVAAAVIVTFALRAGFGDSEVRPPVAETIATHLPSDDPSALPGESPVDVDALASDAGKGLSYVLRVSGLPDRQR